MKALISGGFGFIGSHLAERLIQEGHEISIIDDLSSGSLSNLETVKTKIIRFYKKSICDYHYLLDDLPKADVVFHLATQCLVKGLDNPRLMHQVNDIGTFNICAFAAAHGAKIVFISTSEVYGPQTDFPIKESAQLNPVSIYGQTKAIAEQYVKFFNKIYGVPAVIIRPFNTFGPRQRMDGYAGVITSFIKRVEQGLPPIINGDGLQTRDFNYVSDTVDGIMLLSKLEHGEVVNIGSGQEVSVIQIAREIEEQFNKPYSLLEHRKPRINDLRRLKADITLAKRYGYEPKVTFTEGLNFYMEWWRKNYVKT